MRNIEDVREQLCDSLRTGEEWLRDLQAANELDSLKLATDVEFTTDGVHLGSLRTRGVHPHR